MERKYSEYTNEELLKEQKELKSFSILNAFLIGILIGIIFVSIRFSAYGVSLIIPLFLIYKFANDPKNKKGKELNLELKNRNLN